MENNDWDGSYIEIEAWFTETLGSYIEIEGWNIEPGVENNDLSSWRNDLDGWCNDLAGRYFELRGLCKESWSCDET